MNRCYIVSFPNPLAPGYIQIHVSWGTRKDHNFHNVSFYSLRIDTLHQSFIITFKQLRRCQSISNNAGGSTLAALEPPPRLSKIFNFKLEIQIWKFHTHVLMNFLSLAGRSSITSPLPGRVFSFFKANVGFGSLQFPQSQSKLLKCSRFTDWFYADVEQQRFCKMYT